MAVTDSEYRYGVFGLSKKNEKMTDQEFENWLYPPEDEPRRAAMRQMDAAAGPGQRFNAIREYYKAGLQKILACEPWEQGLPAYEVDWQFTPIEHAFWEDMRCRGAVLYPQYPVGKYFVDFGHPKVKIAVECDGLAYHTDKAKDARRQREIEALGWKVFRITGPQCHEPVRADWCAWERGEPSGMGAGYQLLTLLNYRYGIAVNKAPLADLHEIGIEPDESYYDTDRD